MWTDAGIRKAEMSLAESNAANLPQFILHPPMPVVLAGAGGKLSTSSSNDNTATSLVINPNIPQGGNIAVVSPQITDVDR